MGSPLGYEEEEAPGWLRRCICLHVSHFAVLSRFSTALFWAALARTNRHVSFVAWPSSAPSKQALHGVFV